MAFQRETAHRVFATEFNASRITIEGEGEKAPSFVVTPLGTKVNRVHVVGVCTDVEPVGESGDVFRARISDPTGIHTVYAGQYQAQAAQVLSELQPPAFLAITGKARTFEPEEGKVFTSIRPEQITIVDEETRDQWVLSAAQRTMERVELWNTDDDEGRIKAKENYGMPDPEQYKAMVKGALQGLLPGGTFETHEVQTSDAPAAPAPTWKPEAKDEADPETEAFDQALLDVVKGLEGEKGAQWDDILAKAKDDIEGSDDEAIEEGLNRLMDDGSVYEPTLGVLKTT